MLSRRAVLHGLGQAVAAPLYLGSLGALLATPSSSPFPAAVPQARPRASLLGRGYLSTRRSDILNSLGVVSRLAAVNYYGAECNSAVPAGLDRRSLRDICQGIADLGFNAVRLPYADATYDTRRGNPVIDDQWLSADPQLRGKRPRALDVLDLFMHYCEEFGLKAMMSRHREHPGWSAEGNGLWYTADYPEERGIEIAQTIVDRYPGGTLALFSVANEPGTPAVNDPTNSFDRGALWGYGGRDRDWPPAAERIGNALHRVNPNIVIVVAGVRYDPAGPGVSQWDHVAWPGESLEGVWQGGGARRGPRPVHLDVPGKLAYGVNFYGPAFFSPPHPSRDYYRREWEGRWGYLVRHGIAPVIVTEFGGPIGPQPGNATPPDQWVLAASGNPEGVFFDAAVEYIDELGVSWFFWPLNGTNCLAPGRNPYERDSWGLVDKTWKTAEPYTMSQLQRIQGPPRQHHALS